MAHEANRFALPAVAASAIRAGEPVAMLGAVTPGSARDERVHAAGSTNQDVFGVARATQATPGMAVDVQLFGVVKCIAAASLGAGARVGVGSTNGRLIPLAPAAAASVIRFQVGRALVNAADGDSFAVLLDPGELV